MLINTSVYNIKVINFVLKHWVHFLPVFTIKRCLHTGQFLLFYNLMRMLQIGKLKCTHLKYKQIVWALFNSSNQPTGNIMDAKKPRQYIYPMRCKKCKISQILKFNIFDGIKQDTKHVLREVF